ncbi:MAG: hypothetical protein O2955_14105 [Planctomycetota bacterium]|nr:hypothetical protein [Planctomycetota bacterium]MDA1213645.1 hypothetical protein [Planctomycetota bacterium]
MRILVELVPDDFIAITRFMNSDSLQKHIWGMIFWVSCLLIGFAGSHSLINDDPYYFYIAVVVSILFAFFYNAWVKQNNNEGIKKGIRQMEREGKGAFGKRELRIDDDSEPPSKPHNY